MEMPIDHPYCTISDAAAVVLPGQTVEIEPGNYAESVTISRSGTAAAPITFEGIDGLNTQAEVGNIINRTPITGPALDINGAHYVTVKGLWLQGDVGSDVAIVENSSNVTIDQGSIAAVRKVGVRIAGTSSAITVSRVGVTTLDGPAIAVDSGASGVAISDNSITQDLAGTAAVSITDAPGTLLTSNTIASSCGTGIAVTGSSPNTVIENNIIAVAAGALNEGLCQHPTVTIAVSISTASTSGTVADYNLLDPNSLGTAYVWGGTSYPTVAAFTATGQGGHDIEAAAQLPTTRHLRRPVVRARAVPRRRSTRRT